MSAASTATARASSSCGTWFSCSTTAWVPIRLEPLPATHVDTGMGFERIVSVLQDVDSNYKTDLFTRSLDVLRSLTGHSEEEMLPNFTPYRVIADHARSAAFLIADGVVPGNVGRNYVCRMIIRRAARFGTKIGLNEPFLAKVAEAVIATYGAFYPELHKSRSAILDNLTREEIRFARTVEVGHRPIAESARRSEEACTEMCSTAAAPSTCTPPTACLSRSPATSPASRIWKWMKPGFRSAMETHRIASGGGKAMGKMGGEDAEFFAGILKELQRKGRLDEHGVEYDPYTSPRVEANSWP